MPRRSSQLRKTHRVVVLWALCALIWASAGVVAEEPPQTKALEAETAPTAQAEQEVSKLSSTDLEALRIAVESVDSSYNKAARERDQPTFRELLAKDVIFLADEVKKGRLSMLSIWQHLFDGKYDFRYEANRLETHVAGSGELAWTVGTAVTRFTRPGLDEQVTDSHYLNIWAPNDEGKWQLKASGSLVVHPTLGASRDPRSGLMTAWPELSDQIGADIQIHWTPEFTTRAKSDDVAYSFGEYEVVFAPSATGEGSAHSGKGHFVAVWQKDDRGRWQLAAEGFTPPGIYHQQGDG